MRHIQFALPLVVLLFLVACESSSNYSKQLEQEQIKIDDYLARRGKVVVSEYPADSLFVIGQWYRFSDDGIYICIDSLGGGKDVANGDELAVRYIQSTLDENPVVISYWTTQDRPYPLQIIKGSMTNSCEGWDDAFELMRRSGTIAQVIVPSKLGFPEAATGVIPYHFKLSMKVVPK
ncbi:MAG TPA: DUF4827 family protein [Paludibacteraceae bacterium]|nr:DUF4827 family protein [Paludibacteraceae bacterium]HQB69032.1 DUF4827 family protein [Paludibacteraceae bacterium]HRS67378.1 DUF4827 family protein [Paludibacteraceae bacterium]